jgi:hypothetical protein
MDDMDNFDLLSAEKVAAKYGGDKRKIGEAARMGLVNPTVAVMAGMFIDRMRNAAIKEQQPTTTVAQDTFTPPVQMAQAGLGATPQAQAAPQMPTQMAAAPAQTATLAEGGLTALPVDDDMFPDEYAGGGVVAFQNEGFVDPIFSAPDMGDPYARERTPSQYEMFTKELTLPELQEYYRSGKVPDRLAGQEPSGLGSRGIPLFGGYTGYDLPKAPSKSKDEAVKPAAAAAAPAARSQGAEESKGEGRGASKAAAAPTDYAEYLKSLKTKFGVSDEPDAKAREALDKYKEKLNKDLSKAGALGLVSAGLGIAGGKSRYALQNLQGAIPAIDQYSKAMDKIREGEKGILDSEARMEQAADARRRGDMATAISLEKDARDFALREKTAAAQIAQANRMGSEAEVIDRYAKAKGISFDQAAREIAEMRGEARDPMKAILAERFRNAQKGGAEKIDIRDLITQYPGVTPTR